MVSTRLTSVFPLSYTPPSIELEHSLKPFIPDFIPAVGDIDAFLKVRTRHLLVLLDETNDYLHDLLTCVTFRCRGRTAKGTAWVCWFWTSPA